MHVTTKENTMATDSVYRITELVGTSTKSWEDAAASAVNAASKTLRDLRVAEVIKLDMVVEDGKVSAYRARVALSFKYEPKK
jgi:flavin-binding protein dodecin